MKKIIISGLFLAACATLSAQQLRSGLRESSGMQDSQHLKQMSPDRRQALLKETRENLMMEHLDISEEKKEKFKNLYSQYQDEQREIKKRFSNDFDPDKLTDEEAGQKLEESFEAGEALLNNRRSFARKMQGVLKPQEMLKLFRTEGMLREKMMERRNTIQGSAQPFMQGTSRPSPNPGYRNSTLPR